MTEVQLKTKGEDFIRKIAKESTKKLHLKRDFWKLPLDECVKKVINNYSDKETNKLIMTFFNKLGDALGTNNKEFSDKIMEYLTGLEEKGYTTSSYGLGSQYSLEIYVKALVKTACRTRNPKSVLEVTNALKSIKDQKIRDDFAHEVILKALGISSCYVGKPIEKEPEKAISKICEIPKKIKSLNMLRLSVKMLSQVLDSISGGFLSNNEGQLITACNVLLHNKKEIAKIIDQVKSRDEFDRVSFDIANIFAGELRTDIIIKSNEGKDIPRFYATDEEKKATIDSAVKKREENILLACRYKRRKLFLDKLKETVRIKDGGPHEHIVLAVDIFVKDGALFEPVINALQLKDKKPRTSKGCGNVPC